MAQVTQAILTAIYARLFQAFGPQQWWPAQTRFEVIIGAILTQNTNWGNVEKALRNLKRAGCLSPQQFRKISLPNLSFLIRPAGYFNVKAKRLKNFISFLFAEYDGRLENMRREDGRILREKLLSVNGIGPETADSILLYAFEKPFFVIDVYTKRMLSRHGFADARADYPALQDLFMDALPHDAAMFNEFHALIVQLGKNHCKPKPLCGACILKDFHYSLVQKCSCCHKALLKKGDRVKTPEGYHCRLCALK
ncbi:MAG TPA: endonuclease III domain-containing protein [Candidatus Omnitrophota bacterium]|nr:endonuclease III domain-containing protein [Candidatus Omnitrophota bacterium]